MLQKGERVHTKARGYCEWGNGELRERGLYLGGGGGGGGFGHLNLGVKRADGMFPEWRGSADGEAHQTVPLEDDGWNGDDAMGMGIKQVVGGR